MIRESFGAVLLYYHVVLGQMMKDWTVSKVPHTYSSRRRRGGQRLGRIPGTKDRCDMTSLSMCPC